MTHCRKFCFKAALFCVVIVKSREKWGGISGKREREISFFVSKCPQPGKAEGLEESTGPFFRRKKKKATRKTCISK